MKSISTGRRDGAGEVGHEHEGALQHADEQRGPALVVGGDLGAEGGDPLAQVVLETMTRPSSSWTGSALTEPR